MPDHPEPTSRIATTRGPLSCAFKTRLRWVALVALLLRAVWGIAVPVVPVSDASQYDVNARTLAIHNVYGFRPDHPQLFWPPGPAFMYSLVYRALDPDSFGFAPVVALNVVIGVANVVLTGLLARRWFGDRAGLVAAAILAAWPLHIQFSTIHASEPIFTALCLLGLLLWPHQRPSTAPRLILIGVVFAAACYMRPTALPLPFMLIGLDFLRSWKLTPAFVRGLTVAAVMAACIAPWTARNHRVSGEFVLIAANGGTNFWMGNNPISGGFTTEPPEMPGLNQAQRDRALKQEAWAYIRAEPAAFVKRTLVKAVRLYERETIGVVWNEAGLKQRGVSDRAIAMLKGVSTVAFWWPVLLASLGGAAMLIVRAPWRGLTHVAIAMIAYYTVVHALIVYQDRYHFGLTPVLAALAAVFGLCIWDRLTPKPLESKPA